MASLRATAPPIIFDPVAQFNPPSDIPFGDPYARPQTGANGWLYEFDTDGAAMALPPSDPVTRDYALMPDYTGFQDKWARDVIGGGAQPASRVLRGRN